MGGSDSTVLSPRGLLLDDGSFYMQKVNLQFILDYCNKVKSSEFEGNLDQAISRTPETGPIDTDSGPVNPLQLLQTIKNCVIKLKEDCNTLQTRVLPLIESVCDEIMAYANNASLTYGSLFSNLHLLSLNPTDPTLQAVIHTNVTNLDASIDDTRNTTQALVSGLGIFEIDKRIGVQNFQDLQKRLDLNMIALTDELNKGGLSTQDGIANSQLQWLMIVIEWPNLSMDPQTVRVIEIMIGDFDAIASDLSSVQTIVSADKLETDGKYLLQLDEKLILHKWQALAMECKEYAKKTQQTLLS